MYANAHVYVCKHACLYAEICINVYACMHACTQVCMLTYRKVDKSLDNEVCKYAFMHAYMYAFMHAYMYAFMHACI